MGSKAVIGGRSSVAEASASLPELSPDAPGSSRPRLQSPGA